MHQRHVSRVSDDDGALERIPASEDAGRSLEQEWSEEVRRALARLPEYNREIFLLHYVEGFSYDEIERMTGVRQSALKMRVKRAADALRRHLAREAS